jgi:hypothetical protein
MEQMTTEQIENTEKTIILMESLISKITSAFAE